MSFEDQDSGFGAEEQSDGHLAAMLLDPKGVAERRWLPMALVAALGLVVTIVAVIVWEPVYRSGATVLITSQQISRDFVRQIVDDDTMRNIDAMLRTVMSVENVAAMIEELGLFEGAKAGTEALVWRVRENAEAGTLGRPQRGANSLVYELAYNSSDPEEAALVANALAAQFIEASAAWRNAQSGSATEFLREALARDEAELRELTGEISAFRRAHRGELPDEESGALRKLDGLRAQVISLNNQITIKQDRILSLTSHTGDGALSENEILLGELRRQLARETAAHTDEHPNVIALRSRISRLETMVGPGGGLSPETRRLIDAERRDITRLEALVMTAELEIAALAARIDRMPIVAEEFNALRQREQVLRQDYLDSLGKVEDAELAGHLVSAQQGAQVSILDAARVPSSPEIPRWLVALGGLAASIALAVAIAFLLELIDPVVLGARQIHKHDGSPVLGSLPYVT